MKMLTLLIASTLVFLTSTNQAQVITWDFNSSNGGWTPAVEIGSPSAAAQWQWSLADGVWNIAGANSSRMTLTSPVVTVDSDGPVSFSIHHRFNFEIGFDGGHFRTRTDGGAWTATTNTNVSDTQYNNLSGVSGLTNDPEAFTDTSSGYFTPNFVTSVVDLGSLTAGQTVELQLRAGWDLSFINAAPNWEVDSVTFNLTSPRN